MRTGQNVWVVWPSEKTIEVVRSAVVVRVSRSVVRVRMGATDDHPECTCGVGRDRAHDTMLGAVYEMASRVRSRMEATSRAIDYLQTMATIAGQK
jgi:hypothetical protein